MTKHCTKSLLVILLTFTFNNLNASPQLPDYIIYKNDTIATYNLLVEQYWQKQNPNEDKLFGLSFRNSLDGLGTSFNCWRGYQAIYKIDSDSLFLTAIIDCHSLKSIDVIKSKKNIILLFGNKMRDGKVFIDWFEGDISFPLRIEQNEIIRWDGVFENIFHFETLISIEKGRIVKKENIENYIDDPNRINRKRNDKVTDILFEKIKSYKWTKVVKFDCSETYKIRINKQGEIDMVGIHLTKEEIKDFYGKNEYKHCISSLIKSLKGIKFDVIKRRGIPMEELVYIELWFEEDGTIEN